MRTILITGGSGFFGSLLKNDLLSKGFSCVNIDLIEDTDMHENLTSYKMDIRDEEAINKIFEKHKFDAVFHCAAILAHAVKDKNFLWTSNVDGTRIIADASSKHGVKKFIFISSNCLWGKGFDYPIKEDEKPSPVEIYGVSKYEGEKILLQYTDRFDVVIFRCPTIIDTGRLGLLAILFEFIAEGRKVWVVGGGENIYQFIYARDIIDACILAMDYNTSDVFNIGSDNVRSFREVYSYVIEKAKTKARVASLPKGLTLFAMRVAYMLKLSPMGPYQYKMIASSFVFDTSKIKDKLNWHPTLENQEMLYNAYKYYFDNQQDIKNRKDVSAHKQCAKMGVIRLLKWLS